MSSKRAATICRSFDAGRWIEYSPAAAKFCQEAARVVTEHTSSDRAYGMTAYPVEDDQVFELEWCDGHGAKLVFRFLPAYTSDLSNCFATPVGGSVEIPVLDMTDALLLAQRIVTNVNSAQMMLSFSIKCNSLNQFLDHWSERYRDSSDRDKYDRYVGKPLTEPSRQHLFEWKNGSRLSRAKLASVTQNYPLSFPKTQLAKRYLDPEASGGAIWNIFYMHCIDPETWPIFDQHTYRAMHFMKTGKLKDISSAKAEVYDSYKIEYMPFVKTLNSGQRKIDKALYTFGQFLKIASAYR